MNLFRKIKRVSTVIAIIGAVFLPFMEANAKDRRISAAACHFLFDDAGSNLYVGPYVENRSTSVGYTIVCPVATDSYLSHANAAYLNIHGFEKSGSNNWSRACVKHYNSSGTSCGPIRNWGSNYAGGADIDTSSWNNFSSSFPYLYTTLDKGGQIYGIWYRD